MKNKNFWQGALAGALAMFLTGAVVFGAAQAAGSDLGGILSGQEKVADEKTEQKLEALKELIDDKYLYTDEVEEEKLQEGILAGYVKALGDPYSSYYDEEETKEQYESAMGEYSGIGVVFSQNYNTMIITADQVYTGSPAEESGVKAGDILYKVNGIDITGKDLSKIVQQIRGVEGTTVELTVLRGEAQEEVTMEIERRKVEAITVEQEMKADGIGYIRVTEFNSVAYEQFKTALADLEAQDMKGLVIDLRANPGGNVYTVCQMLDLLLPKGTIVSTKEKNGEKEEIKSDEEHKFEKPLAVLVNEKSASASEIFAGAIQDYGLGPIVGTTTFGKGIVQEFFDFNDGSSVKLTMAEYFTPKGRNIHKKGIEPDVEVKYEKDEENPEADNQLDAAIREVQKKTGQ